MLYIGSMLLLAIETSSARGSLALLDGEALIGEAPFPEGLVHGREVTVHLERLMTEAGLRPGRLGAIAVGLGPGSYTGIRVGVTAAKTLALALRIPVISESSLRVIAANASPDLGGPGGGGLTGDRQVVPAVDGKQRHVYLARFRIGDGAAVAREEAELAVELPGSRKSSESRKSEVGGRKSGRAQEPPAAGRPPPASPELRAILDRTLAPGALVVGDAADAVLAIDGAPAAVRGPRSWDWPSAAVLGRLAARSALARPSRFDPEAVHLLVPIYLRSSEAERKMGIA